MDDVFAFDLMPFTEDDFFWITFTGEATLRRLYTAHAAYLEHPAFRPGGDELLDFRGASIASNRRAELGQMRDALAGLSGREACRCAIVLGSSLDFGLGRMAGGMMALDVPGERFVTRDLQAALEWLRPDAVSSIRARRQERFPTERDAAGGER